VLYHKFCAHYDEALVCRTDSAMLISLQIRNTLRAGVRME